LRKEERETKKNGEEMLSRFLSAHEIPVSSIAIEKLAKAHKCSAIEQFYLALGSHSIVLSDADLDVLREREGSGGWKRFFAFARKSKKDVEEAAPSNKVGPDFDRKQVLQLSEESIQSQYALSPCCKPIPGDRVMGYIDDNQQIVIHQLNCPVANRLKANHGNRILAAEWTDEVHRKLLFPIGIYIEGLDRIGLLNEITQVISLQMSANMRKLNVECVEGIFECRIQLYVHDTREVEEVVKKLQNIEGVKTVSRV
jgi:GTP pyrophosphokinase